MVLSTLGFFTPNFPTALPVVAAIAALVHSIYSARVFRPALSRFRLFGSHVSILGTLVCTSAACVSSTDGAAPVLVPVGNRGQISQG